MSNNNTPLLKKICSLALLSLIASPAWSGQINFCKTIRTFDEQDLSAAPIISHEDCSGIAFYDYAKDLVKASCWNGAFDLTEGKCETDNHSSGENASTENSEIGAEDEIPLNQLE